MKNIISTKLAKELLDLSLSTGADFSELYFEDTTNENIYCDNSKIESFVTSSLYGVGIRIIKNDKSVYGYTNEINKQNLIKLINNLNKRFDEKQTIYCQEIKNKKIKYFNKINTSYFDIPAETKINMLLETSKYMKEFSPLIVRTITFFKASKSDIEIFNSNGLHAKDHREYIRLIAEAFAHENGVSEIGFNSEATFGGFDFYKNIDLKKLGTKTASEAISILKAKNCPSGKMTVIVGNSFGGVLFHEACGHSLEATSVAKNLSVFSNKLNQQIASKIVNAYDDATIANKWGSSNMDDEGHTPHNNQLIKDGVLVGYLVDQFNGRRMNYHETGSSRRESYKYEPTSRMSNTYIGPGNSTKDEIIANTKLGLYAVKFSGGSVDPTTGQFEFACNVAYIVRDGKICEQVKGATLIGKGEEILKNIDMVGNDLDFDVGYCGSISGNVPVTTGQPTIRIQNILVGGSGEELK